MLVSCCHAPLYSLETRSLLEPGALAILLSLTPLPLGVIPGFEVDTRDLNLGLQVCVGSTFTH